MSESLSDGMSPVIGVVLLTGITVTLVAIIGAVVMGMAAVPESKQITLVVSPGNQLADSVNDKYYPVISVTIFGGRDVSELLFLNVSLEGATGVYFVGTNKHNPEGQGIRKSSGLPVTLSSSSIVGASLNYLPLPIPGPVNDSWGSEFLNKTYHDNSLVTVTGTFSDGSRQILYSGRMKIHPAPKGHQQRMNGATVNVSNDPNFYWQSPVIG